MSFSTGPPKSSWEPIMTGGDTTISTYWLNWRVLLCAIWVLISMIFSFVLIWKYEGFRNSQRNSRETEKERSGVLYEDEVWRPCIKGIHPAWLLAFRVVAFFVLLSLLIVTARADGGRIFYFYTQWTFTLITIYFGIGSVLSMYGCYRYHSRVGGDKVDNVEVDAEQEMTSAGENSTMSSTVKNSSPPQEHHGRKPASIWGYAFQIVFQMNAGAVMLTDCVFWFILVPFLTIKDYDLNFLVINMHSINAVFLLGDTALNSLRFPWFRIAYFFLWTIIYVIFQWIVHACVQIWWPYPFLDLSSSYAPLWYSSVAVMHIPCYGIFSLIIRLKHFLLSRWYPESYQCRR